jgi:hypothetical protein
MSKSKKPAVKKPAVKKPAVKKPAAKKPAAKKPAPKKSAPKTATASPAHVALAKTLRTAADRFEKRAALRSAASAESVSEAALLWSLFRGGLVDLWKDAGLWQPLGDDPDAATTDDVMALLASAPATDAAIKRGNSTGVLGGWPEPIDRLVFAVHLQAPDVLPAAWHALPPPARAGAASVLRRAGVIDAKDVPPSVLQDLAAGVAAGGGGGLHLLVDGTLQRVDGLSPRFLDLVRMFASADDWGRALLPFALRSTTHSVLPLVEDAVRLATTDELGKLLRGFQAPHAEGLLTILLDERTESADWFHQRALKLSGPAYSGPPEDICALAAILRSKRDGAVVPRGWEKNVTFEAVWSSSAGYAGPRHVESLRYLGTERAAAQVRKVNEYHLRWQSMAALPAVPALIDEVIDRIERATLATLSSPDEENGAKALGALGPLVLARAEAALARAKAPATRAFFGLVVQVAGGAAPVAAPPAPPAEVSVAELARRAIAALPADAATTRVFLLERDEDDEPSAWVSRIGGAPVGVSAEAWPRHGKGKDARMEHLLTLAAADLPGATLPDGAAAVALFIRNREHNDATSPDTDETAVLLLSEDDLAGGTWAGAAPPRELEACALRVTAVDVPAAVFGEDIDGDLAALRTALLQCPGYALGEPIWLQEAEDVGDFVCQLDASLVPMNLGDQGVLYVFTSAAFWQSA